MRYIFFSLFILSIPVFSQQELADSLENRLYLYKKEDSIRLKTYTGLLKAYSTLNPEKGLLYADSALALQAKLKNSNKFLPVIYKNKADIYLDMGNYKTAEIIYQKGISASERYNDKGTGIACLHNYALAKSRQSKYKEAIELYGRALKLARSIHDSGKEITILNSIGANYFYLSDYQKAIDNYYQALLPAETEKNYFMLGQLNENIGLIYKKMEDKRCFGYYDKALKFYEQINAPEKTANLFSLYGNAFDQFGETAKAIAYYEKGLSVAQKNNDEYTTANIYANLGIAYYSQKEYSLAISYLNRVNPELDPRIEVYTRNYLAKIYLEAPLSMIPAEMGINSGNRFEKAFRSAHEALNKSIELDLPEAEMFARETLSDIYEKTGKYESALKEFKAFKIIEDSIISNQNKEELIRRDMQYESDKKQAVSQLELQKREAEIQKRKVIQYFSIGLSALALLSGGVLFTGYKKRRKAKETEKELLLKNRISETEMKILRLQMNPHFIFNSLNSIGDFVQKNDSLKADYYLAKFAKLMRATLENSREKEISLSEEIKMLKLYMDLESSRLNNKFTYVINVADDIDPDNTYIPPLLLQPFVENSIWHGLAQKEGSGKILIEVTKEKNILKCIVEDDGMGRNLQKDETDKPKSYGMSITKERLVLLNRLNVRADLAVFDLKQGTRVELKLPLQEEL